MPGVTPVSTVGSKKNPSPGSDFPPHSSLAPASTERRTWSSRAVRRSWRARGPTCVVADVGSPTTRAWVRSTNLAVNSSATFDATMKRLAHTQLCPPLWKRAFTAAVAAASTSASSSTMNASEPPNSSTDFFEARPAAAPAAAPARLEPVRVTAAMRSSAIRPSMTLGTSGSATTSVVRTFAGRPASTNNCCNASALPVTLGECFSRMPLPATSEGMAKRMTCQTGKFQGITAKTRPTGS